MSVAGSESFLREGAACTGSAFASPAASRSRPPVDDAALTTTIQNQLTADNSINGQPVQVAVSGGVATLSGSVQNDAQRTIAARDAAGVTRASRRSSTTSR